jgi:hypothetical protein
LLARRDDVRHRIAMIGLLLSAVSLFGERAVSSPRPTFQTAPRAASVKRGAEQPAATRSAL